MANTPFHNLHGVSGVIGTSTAKVINRVVIRHHGHNNQIGGSVWRPRHGGQATHTFLMSNGTIYKVKGV